MQTFKLVSLQVSFGDLHAEAVNVLLNEMTDDDRYMVKASFHPLSASNLQAESVKNRESWHVM